MPATKRQGAVASAIDCNALLQQLQRIQFKQPDVIPDGFKTAAEWAKLWGKTERTANKLLLSGLRAGILEANRFRVMNGKDRTKQVRYFRALSSGN